MTPIRLIQVGMGGWGRDWARLLARSEGLAETVAYVDIRPEMLVQLQTDVAGVAERCYPALKPVLEGIDAEAVLVTTALADHIPVVLEALAAGKHVLVEKPFAPSVVDAQQAVALAAEQQRVLMVSQNYRFYPAVQTVAALIREGVLGPVGHVSIQFRKYANIPPRETHWHYTLHHPLLMDMAIHHFDLMRYVLGQEPKIVNCYAWNPSWSKFSDPAAALATITFNGGAVADYNGSWVSTAPPTLWAGAWQIECAEGIISWTSRADTGTAADTVTIRPRGKRARRVPLPELPYADRLGSLAAFATAIRTATEPSSSGRDNLSSLALMTAAIESAQSGQPQIVAY